MNKVIIIGRTTREVELRYLPSGSAVAKTAIAVSEKWKDKTSGEIKEETMFIDIVVYGKSAEIFNQYVQKGHKVAIEGKLKLEQWVDQSGAKKSKHIAAVESYEFLESKQQSETSEDKPRREAPPKQPEIDIQDDEIPF